MQKQKAAENYNLLQQSTPSNSSEESVKKEGTFREFMMNYDMFDKSV